MDRPTIAASGNMHFLLPAVLTRASASIPCPCPPCRCWPAAVVMHSLPPLPLAALPPCDPLLCVCVSHHTVGPLGPVTADRPQQLHPDAQPLPDCHRELLRALVPLVPAPGAGLGGGNQGGARKVPGGHRRPHPLRKGVLAAKGGGSSTSLAHRCGRTCRPHS